MASRDVTWLEWFLAAIVGLGLALGVWNGLAKGGGLVGGDTYPYFLPQKIVLADSLARGELPLWHNLTGLGYPLHAESQAGVFYPTNQILYRLFPVNMAYNTSIIVHYWLAFVFAWRFARCQRISMWPALLAALVYVYGWFPARISLEWSIIGGLCLPLTLWLTELLVDSPSAKRIACLAGCLGIHLLAGHFTLAFINQLAVLSYAALRIMLSAQNSSCAAIPTRRFVLFPAAVAAGLLVSAVQLVPSYELKLMSQREGDRTEFDPTYGHMPPVYGTQLVASWWYWHTPEMKATRAIMKTPGAVAADTNTVEAHLYWGLIPFGLVVCGLVRCWRHGFDSRAQIIWLVLSIGGLVYATGWLMPVTRHLPGFGFFMGPGRYTILTALGGGLLSAMMLDRITRRFSRTMTAVLTTLLCTLTLPDLQWSSQTIQDAVVVEQPPIAQMDTSWLRQTLTADGGTPKRLLAPGPNVGNLFGVSCIPQYLGIGPAVYQDSALRPSMGADNPEEVYPRAETIAQLESLGVSHILTLDPISRPSNDLEELRQYPDTFLNAIWARGGKSCFLYRLRSEPQRVAADPTDAMTSFQLRNVEPDAIEIEVDLTAEASVILRELMYPGWTVTVDGEPAVSDSSDGIMRSVLVSEGIHTIRWTFNSNSFYIGAAISIAILTCLLAMVVSEGRRAVSADSPLDRKQDVTV
ncbi:MAG: hypothetical protein P8J37_20175 [Fuerstiella sp.]|nr:hypothetical protein [Fuerstiella sp.]